MITSMNRLTGLICIWVLASWSATGQSGMDTLLLSEYLDQVQKEHPVARAARLSESLAESERLYARGHLDPVINSSLSNKNFDDKVYYNYYKADISVPTTLGLKLKAGYEYADGIYLNAERTVPENGLWYAGVELNLLQGLLINERHIALKKARTFGELKAFEQDQLISLLSLNAAEAYIAWQKEYYSLALLGQAMDNAKTYLDNTKMLFRNGEGIALDTLEAHINYFDSRIAYAQGNQNLIASQRIMESFLWDSESPIARRITAVPERPESMIVEYAETDTLAPNNHPELGQARSEIAMAQLDLRLQKEARKPELNIKYQTLLGTGDDALQPQFSSENYRWGLGFYFPIFMRKARGKYQQGQLKILELQNKLDNKENTMNYQVRSLLDQLIVLEQQIAFAEQNVENSLLLLRGEEQKFDFGESSVFLLNKRREKYYQSQIKVIELLCKRQSLYQKLTYYLNGYL